MKVTAGFVIAAIAITTAHAGNSHMEQHSPSESGSSAVDTSCPDACLAVMRPVFDEDGKMYSNECTMRAAKCKGKKKDVNILEEYKRLYGKSFGASRDDTGDDSASDESGSSSDAPTFVKGTMSASDEDSGEDSVEGSGDDSTDGSDEAYCPDVMCLAVYSPVYDEDGTMYSNACEMSAAKCKGKRKNVNILDEYKRLYGRSFGASRPEDAGDDSASEESGSSSATKIVKGTKGAGKAAKKSTGSSSNIGSLYNDGSDGVIGSNSDASTPSTKCASGCPDVELPVCGSDGVTYSNPCELKIAACENPDLDIVVAEDEACTKVTTQDDPFQKKSTGDIRLH